MVLEYIYGSNLVLNFNTYYGSEEVFLTMSGYVSCIVVTRLLVGKFSCRFWVLSHTFHCLCKDGKHLIDTRTKL
jgi:hypothetical protein